MLRNWVIIKKNVVESDEAFYDRVSGCHVRKLPSDLASRYSKITTHMLAKQANKEKSTGLAKQNFGLAIVNLTRFRHLLLNL